MGLEPGQAVAQDQWQLRLLDNFRLVGPQGDVALSARKSIALLAYLGMQPDGMARRDVLATLLWENADPSQARVSLRQAVAAIRRVEGDHPPILVSDGDFLRLTSDVSVDIRDFERLAGGSHAERVAAAQRYRTDVLGGFSLRDSLGFNEWLGVEQARIRQRVVAVLQRLIDDALESEGDSNGGIAHALRLLSLDPFNEAAHRALMLLYARQGRASLALAQYRSLSDLLRRELAVAPEAETTRVHEDIRSGRRRIAEPKALVEPPLPDTLPAEAGVVADPAPAPLPSGPVRRSKRRMPWIAAGAGALLLCAGAGAMFLPALQAVAPPRLGEVYAIARTDDPEMTPAISPDGEQIVFAMTRNENTDLYLLPASGEGKPLRLTDGPEIERPAQWRPDGLAIAFVRMPRSGDRPCEIVLKAMPAGDERVIGHCLTDYGTAISWMPDGKSLIFRDMPRLGAAIRLYRLDVETGRTSELTHPPATILGDLDPSASHDGSQLVFERVHAIDSIDLMLLDLASGQERKLVSGIQNMWSAVWQRGDRGIIFSANFKGDSGLWWVDPRRSDAPHRLSTGISQFHFMSYSAKRNRLVFEAAQTRDSLLQLPPDATLSTRPQPLAGVRPGLFSRFPVEARNGDVAFVASRSGGDEIWITSPGQTARQRTRFGGWRLQDLSWSPDGSWIAFVGVRGGVSDLYLLRRDGGEPVRLTSDAAEDTMPAWSPDGQSLYFGSRRSGAWRVWNIDPAHPATARAVTGDGPWRALPSADGRHLYYVVDGKSGIRRRALSGTRLTGNEEMVEPRLHPGEWRAWGLAGNQLFYVNRNGIYGAAHILRRDLATGATRVMADASRLAFTLSTASFSVRPNGGLLLAGRETQLDIYGAELD